MADTKLVEREIFIAASPETVWKLLVDGDQIVSWMGSAATVDLRLGGRYRIEVLPGQIAAGEFLEIEEPRRLRYSWGWDRQGSPVPPGSTTVLFQLLPRPGGTLLRLTHSGLPTSRAADRHDHGWTHYLERLGMTAAGNDPGTDPWIASPPGV